MTAPKNSSAIVSKGSASLPLPGLPQSEEFSICFWENFQVSVYFWQ